MSEGEWERARVRESENEYIHTIPRKRRLEQERKKVCVWMSVAVAVAVLTEEPTAGACDKIKVVSSASLLAEAIVCCLYGRSVSGLFNVKPSTAMD